MIPFDLVNNLRVLLAGLLDFRRTIAVGFLEIGELGREHDFSLLTTIFLTGLALLVMGAVGFHVAFASTWSG